MGICNCGKQWTKTTQLTSKCEILVLMPLKWSLFDLILHFIYFLLILYLALITWHQCVLFCYELGGVCVCGGVWVWCVWVWVCLYECLFVLMLGWGGRDLGWVCCFSCVVLRLGFLWKMPCDLRHPFLLQSFLHNIIGAFGGMLGKILGLALCNSCLFSASLFGNMLLPVLPL